MTTDNPDPLEVWKAVIAGYDKAYAEHVPVTHAIGREKSVAADQAAAAIIAQHYAPVIAERDKAIAWATEQHACADRYAAKITDLEALVGELGEALVVAMIPIEAMLLSGADAAHCQDVRDAMHDAQATARSTLAKLENSRGKDQTDG